MNEFDYDIPFQQKDKARLNWHERKYIEAMLTPFMNNCIYVVRERYYLRIYVIGVDDEKVITIPYCLSAFNFDGLSMAKRYDVKELGLFK